MDIHSATEEAYKKGYEDGKREGIVHCKDCRFWYKNTLSCDFVYTDTNWYEEDFCSYGERKDNG